MGSRNVIKLLRGAFCHLGDRALKLWAEGKGSSSGRRKRIRRRSAPTPRSGVWSDFNRANAHRFANSSTSSSAPVQRSNGELVGFGRTKIAFALLLAASLAFCIWVVIIAQYRSHPLIALGSTPETRLVKRIHGDSTLQGVSSLTGPRLLPIQVLPDPIVTPGDAQNISLAEIKKLRSTPARLPNIPSDVKRRVFLSYGLRVDETNYQLDHLIPLSLGGSDAAKNLWPHSRKGSFWTVEKKLTLEKRVYRLVCAGRLSLIAARQEVASNWPKAYRKYVDTTAPMLPEHGADNSSISAAQSSSRN
jgi:hypothetical protein